MADTEKNLTILYNKLGNLEHDFLNSNLINLILSKVKGNSVLDIGCGNGFLLSCLNKVGKKTFGIEPNKELIKLAKQNNPKLNIFQGYAEDIGKLVDKKIDNITMVNVLEHIKNDDLQIKKVHNFLNNNGRFIVFVPSHKFLYGKYRKKYGDLRSYNKKELVNKLSENGFRVTYIRHWNMLGFFLLLFYETILQKELDIGLRTNIEKSFFKKITNKILNLWFKYVENNFNFGFGLSLICVAEKNKA